MGLIFKAIYLLILINFLLSCTNNNLNSSKLNVKTVKDFHFVDSTYVIQIDNLKEDPVKFNININDIFPLDYVKLNQEIEKLSIKSKISYESAAWIYVSNNTYHSKPLTSENWQHNPLIFLNSIGGGLCDDRASVLSKLWMNHGDSSRIIGLEGHVVPEVFVNQKWQMFDPDYKVNYCDENNIPTSVKDLESSKDSVLITKCHFNYVSPLFKYPNPISKKVTSFYKSDNNEDVTQWHLNYSSEFTNDFILPSFSTLKIGFNKNTGVINFVVELNLESKGQLKIPLVPINATGKAQFLVDEQNVLINGKTDLTPQKHFYSEIEVVKVDKKTKISYLINPKLSVFKVKNKIELNSSDTLNLLIKSSSEKFPNTLFGEEYLFFDMKSIEYKGYLDLIANYNNETIDKKFIDEKFLMFLDYDESLTQVEKLNYINQFQKDYSYVTKTFDNNQQSIIKKEYPRSIFYLFLGSKYQKMDYIYKILNQQK